MSTQKFQEFSQKPFYITLIIPERWGCGSHILCSVHCTMTSPTNVDPKCASCSAKLISTDCMYGCIRGSSQYSQLARCAPQTYQKNRQNETLRPGDMHEKSLVSCKLVCNMDVLCMQCKMLWRAKWIFICTMWYALVWKMNVCMYHACLLPCHEFAKSIVLTFVTCSNCLNCNWKRASVLTLLNTIAQKFYPCILYCILPFT